MCMHKENGPDVPLGAQQPQQQDVDAIGLSDNGHPSHAFDETLYLQIIQHLNSVIEQKDNIIQDQHRVIQDKDTTIQQLEQQVAQQGTTIGQQNEIIEVMQERIDEFSGTIELKTQEISQLSHLVSSLTYSNPAKAEYQPNQENIKHILDRLAPYTSPMKEAMQNMQRSMSEMMNDNHLAVVASNDKQQQKYIVVSSQFLAEFIKHLVDNMSPVKRTQIIKKKRGVIPQMAHYLVQQVKVRRRPKSAPQDIGYHSMRETIRRAFNNYAKEH